MKTLLYQQGLDRQVVEETSQDKNWRTTLLCKMDYLKKKMFITGYVHLCRESRAMDFLTKRRQRMTHFTKITPEYVLMIL